MIEVNEAIIRDINEHFITPPKPQLLTDLQNFIKSDKPSLQDEADVIAKDVAIASAILKIINSPAYGLARTVSDIKQAVMFLGWDGVTNLVQGLKLKEAFSDNSCCISLGRFWDTASEIANVSMLIEQKVDATVPPENLYALGLFHDCGVPPMAIKFKQYVKALQLANDNYQRGIVEVEEHLFKTNHAVIGYLLAASWHLPKDICQLILRHHDLGMVEKVTGDMSQVYFAILKLAENIVSVERRYKNSRDWPLIEGLCCEVLGITREDCKDLQDDATELLN